MSDDIEPLDWALYFSTLSDKCLEGISNHLHRENMKRANKKYHDTLPPLDDHEIDLVERGQYINAIKDYRTRTRNDLRASKFAVDQYNNRNNPAWHK